MLTNIKKVFYVFTILFFFHSNLYSSSISTKKINPFNADNTINAFIEIPAGTTEKWEMSQDGKFLNQELQKKGPREINYLPYPINYGFIPQTILSKNVGGDGDMLDVIVIGPRIKRGSIVKVNVIGMLEIIDEGKIDSKILSVLIRDGLKISEVNSLSDLKKDYAGILEIISIWFENYKGTKLKIKNIFGKKRSFEEIKLRHTDFLSEN